MSEMYAHVSVKILEKEYQLSGLASERKALLESAEALNKKMREIRESGKVVGLDRIAVMAALNLAHDLIRTEHSARKDGAATVLLTSLDSNFHAVREDLAS